MNKREIAINKQKSLDLIDRSSQYGTRINCAKCWKGTSRKHWNILSDIVWKLINEYDYTVIPEATFKVGGRADIFYIDNQGFPGVIEVLESETDKRFNTKLESYPVETIIKVRTSEYTDDWCL